MTSLQCSQCSLSDSGRAAVALLVGDGPGDTVASDALNAVGTGWLCLQCHPRSGRLCPDSQRSLCVLVVDDQELVLRSMVRLLSDFETVVAVRNSRAALEMLRNGRRFDVVISDVTMPDMNGPELYARCYAHSPDVGDSFVFASGDAKAARELVAAAVARVGAARTPVLLKKPTTKEALTAAVLQAAERGARGQSEPGPEITMRRFATTEPAAQALAATFSRGRPTHSVR
jgi:CheY-like chemotaxis protein